MKVDLFNLGHLNAFGLDNIEVEAIISTLTKNGYDTIFEDWKETKLKLPLSKKIYKVFKELIVSKINNIELQEIANCIKKKEEETINCITNFFYSMTYHHNKSHYIIKYIHKYVNYKFGAQGLINQVHYAMNDQRIGVNQILHP